MQISTVFVALVNYNDRHSCAVTSCVVTLKNIISRNSVEMSCNFQIHEELKNMMEATCLFCDRLLVEFHKVVESCCSEQDIEL